MTDASKGRNLVLDDDLKNVIISGVKQLFSTTFGCEVKVGNPFASTNYGGNADVSGSIGMIQEESEGILSIGFPKKLILSIMSKMYKKEFTELDRSVCEGVGEITNVSYALARQGLNRIGYNFRMSVPQVVVGEQHEIHHMHHGETLVIPFFIDEDQFVVFVTLQKSEKRES